MNLQTQILHNVARDGHSYNILKNGYSDNGLPSPVPYTGQESHPSRISRCNVEMANWKQSAADDQRPAGSGNSKTKAVVSRPSGLVERQCVVCKKRGPSFIRSDVIIFVLTIMTVVLAFGVINAHMKLSHVKERLAKLERERTESKRQMPMLTHKSPALPTLNFQYETRDTDLMEIGDVERSSERRRRDTMEASDVERRSDPRKHGTKRTGDVERESTRRRRHANQKNQGKNTNKGQRKTNKCNKNLINQYCFDKIEGVQPTSNEFEGLFEEIYPKDRFKKKESKCFQDDEVANRPQVCKEQTINYEQRESPLAFYVSVKGTNTNLLNITNKTDGEFTMQESGVFLMQFSIVMIDYDKNRSIGVYVDDTPVMACPPGGYKKPKEKLDNYRICSFNGILQMNKGNKLQLKTMEPNTKVRIENHEKSVMKITLLHRLMQ